MQVVVELEEPVEEVYWVVHVAYREALCAGVPPGAPRSCTFVVRAISGRAARTEARLAFARTRLLSAEAWLHEIVDVVAEATGPPGAA